MANDIHRKGDANDAGANITSTKQTAVKVGGQSVATDGDPSSTRFILMQIQKLQMAVRL